MTSLRRVSCCLFMILATTALAAESDNDKLQTAISYNAERFCKAFADQDANALGEFFTPDAEYVDADGTVFHGRKAIVLEYTAAFEVNPPGTLNVELVSIRPIAPGVVTEEGISTFRPKDSETTVRTRYTVTHVRQADGVWLMASVRELSSASLTIHDRLNALKWLEGKWREERNGSTIDTEWKWSDDGNFLLSEFFIRESMGEMKGSHRIGWDAERKQFRSWIFDSTGGSVDGWWRSDEQGSWSVTLNGVDADGVRRSMVLNYTPDGADAIVLSETQRTHGEATPPDAVHRIVRQPPPPANRKI